MGKRPRGERTKVDKTGLKRPSGEHKRSGGKTDEKRPGGKKLAHFLGLRIFL